MANYFEPYNTCFYVDPNQYCLFNNFCPVQIINPFEMQNFFQYSLPQNQYRPVVCNDLSGSCDVLESLTIQKQINDQKKGKKAVQKLQNHKNDDSNDYCLQQQNFSRRGLQNERRNVMPNLIHQILNFLNTESKSGVLVRKLIKTLGKAKLTTKKFYSFQKLIRRQISRYINLKTFLQILSHQKLFSQHLVSKQEQIVHFSIMRRLILYFLKSQAVSVTVYSSKIKKQNRLYHFEAQKKMMKALQEQKQISSS